MTGTADDDADTDAVDDPLAPSNANTAAGGERDE